MTIASEVARRIASRAFAGEVIVAIASMVVVWYVGITNAAEHDSGLPRPKPRSISSIRELEPYFELGECSIEPKTGEKRVIPYCLLRPRAMKPAKAYPLIVWLHGYGPEEVMIRSGQLMHLWEVFPNRQSIENCEFFVLAPQNAASASWYPEPGDALVDLIEEVAAEDPIDRNRIVLVGISSGAKASWQFAARHPDLFAAVAPLAGFLPNSVADSSGSRDGALNAIAKIPVWTFHSAEETFSSDDAQNVIADLQSRGGRCALTVIPWRDHNCWTAAFREHHLLKWLLSPRMGDPGSILPGEATVPGWTAFARTYWPQMTVLLVVVCALVELNRRRQSATLHRKGTPPTGNYHEQKSECMVTD